MSLRQFLLSPRSPSNAAGFVDDNFAVVELRRSRGAFSIVASALTQLPPGLLTPSFTELNVRDPEELAAVVLHTSEAAGLANRRKWSIALPDASARSFVVSLDGKPHSKRELAEIIQWKVERLLAMPASSLRISRQRLSPMAGQERYLVTVAQDEVLAQYEEVFTLANWESGLLLPRHLGEVQWLIWDNGPGDKMLVSANRFGFTSVILRNGEPALVRAHACDSDALPDELHRFSLYYRDRIGGSEEDQISVLVLGGVNAEDAIEAVSTALEKTPLRIEPSRLGMKLSGEPIPFDQLAGAAGLATLGWS